MTGPVPMRRRARSAIDLFSGCGGLSQGLRDAGLRVVAAVESDGLSVETYRRNHPDVKIWPVDIREVDPSEVLRVVGLEPGELDLLAGCPPCQGFSRLRTLNGSRGIDDQRNDLVFEFLRFTRTMLPKTLMFENVPGLYSDQRLDRLNTELVELGYVVEARVRDAADFGVPQRRKRLILLGGRGVAVAFPEPVGQRRTVRDAIVALPVPGESGDISHDVTEGRTTRIAELIRSIPHDGGSMRDLGPDRLLACHQRCDGFYDVYGRMAWDEVSPTITSGFVNPSKGRFLHPEQDRCITPREAALLQSVPAHYRFMTDRGKYPTAAMIGNAFPPRFAEVHAAAAMRALDGAGAGTGRAP